MDSKLVNDKAAEFADRKVRLSPELIAQLGLEKKSGQLRIDEFFVSCVPFDLSLRKASLLSFLSEAEIAFFAKMAGRPHKLSLTFNIPYSSKPVSFFVLCDIKSFRKPSPSSPYCFIDVDFREAPLVLKEILVAYFIETDEAERFFREGSDEPVTAETAVEVFGSPRLALLRDDGSSGRLKICRLSRLRLRVFGEIEGAMPAIGDVLELEPCEGDPSCLARGKLSGLEPLPEVEGFAFLDLELEYCARLHAKLRKCAATGRRRAGGEA